VSHTLFDHTSIIKTILLRFCAADLNTEIAGSACPPGSEPAIRTTWEHASRTPATWENF
jgi:hypothetical protein